MEKYKGLETSFDCNQKVIELWNNFQTLSSIEPPVEE
jgi:hypothetical protein